jgi:hypothetical protein
MPRPPIISNLHAKQRKETRWTLAEFNMIVQSHLTGIDETQHSLQLVYIPFEIEDANIRPVECKKAINALREMDEKIQEFCKLLDETSHLPAVITILRYRFLFILHLVEEEIYRLIDLIDSYREICMTPNRSAQRLRNDIQDGFEALLQHISGISRKVDFLEHEARFQERKLETELKEKASIDDTRPANPGSLGRPVYIAKKRKDTIEL